MFQKQGETLSRIEKYIKEEHKDIKATIKDIDERVTRLESFQTKAMTTWAIAITLVGYLLNKFL